MELRKFKSWLKSVSAFLNTSGGTIIFGVTDSERKIVGVANAHETIEKMSELIYTKIEPTFIFQLKPMEAQGKQLIVLDIQPGASTPYYYVDNGTRIAYVRKGSSSVEAKGVELNNLILRGSNKTYDMLPSRTRLDEISFTLLAAEFKRQTGTDFVMPKDLISCGLVNSDDILTLAGALICDQGTVMQSRIFCTHWNGLSKGSVAQDAVDDKEYQGMSIINLLGNAETFVKNNSKNRWQIAGMIREEENEYPYEAVREALVNAIMHRDYQIIGSEIHIDIFEDRLEVYSPGGMLGGHFIQDMKLTQIPSRRRNQVISDVFGRLGYMDRRGSGINRILNAYKASGKMVGFFSNDSSFIVTLPNMLYRAQISIPNLFDKDDDKLTSKLTPRYQLRIEEMFSGGVRRKTVRKTIALYDKYGANNIWSRADIAQEFNVSGARATVVINILLAKALITKVARGKYKFVKL